MAVSCAKGSAGDTGGVGSGPGGGGSGGVAGAGGDGGMGGVVPPCSEQPCKLTLAQCGCADGEKCTLTMPATRACVPDGTIELGEACNQFADECKAGGRCINVLGNASCLRFCTDDADCGGTPGAKCALDYQGSVDKLCSINCDPITGTGCLPANSKCESLQLTMNGPVFTSCVASGVGVQGDMCSDTGDCSAGYGCFTVTNMMTMTVQCLRWCNVNMPFCTVGTCQTLTPPLQIGSINYGVCF